MKFTGPRCGAGEPKRKREPSSIRRSLEYPCVSRLRRRRLLAFLSRHGFTSTFQALLQETTVFFSVDHLQSLARQAQWDDAIKYVVHFLPKIDAMVSEEGRLLVSFVNLHKTVHSISISRTHGALITEVYERELRMPLVWNRAAEIIKDLIAKAPEFNDLLRLPNCRDEPHNILPIRFRSCYYFFGSSNSRRRHHRKEGGRIPASDLTKFYLQKKRSRK